MSFGKGTFTIVDEAEDLTVKEIKSVLHVLEGTLILAGDIEQSALNDKSGLRFIKDMADKYPELENVSGFVDFNRPSDIVRSDECKV